MYFISVRGTYNFGKYEIKYAERIPSRQNSRTCLCLRSQTVFYRVSCQIRDLGYVNLVYGLTDHGVRVLGLFFCIIRMCLTRSREETAFSADEF